MDVCLIYYIFFGTYTFVRGLFARIGVGLQYRNVSVLAVRFTELKYCTHNLYCDVLTCIRFSVRRREEVKYRWELYRTMFVNTFKPIICQKCLRFGCTGTPRHTKRIVYEQSGRKSKIGNEV